MKVLRGGECRPHSCPNLPPSQSSARVSALAPALRTISGETPHYRARFEVAAADGADAAEAVKEVVMGWLHAKGLDVPEGAADIAVPAGWTAADEPDAAKAVRFLGLSGAQGAAWAVEADELDGEFSRRRWHTRSPRARRRRRCILNVQVSYYAANGFFGYQRNPLPSVPRVVRDILANGKLDVRIGASRVSVEEIYLDADALKRDFMPSLTDRARCLPIVLMTTDDDGKTPVGRHRARIEARRHGHGIRHRHARRRVGAGVPRPAADRTRRALQSGAAP
ncbi:MAG: hypothetical protein ACLT98_00295 [Eggerthellaceae bacterium]